MVGGGYHNYDYQNIVSPKNQKVGQGEKQKQQHGYQSVSFDNDIVYQNVDSEEEKEVHNFGGEGGGVQEPEYLSKKIGSESGEGLEYGSEEDSDERIVFHGSFSGDGRNFPLGTGYIPQNSETQNQQQSIPQDPLLGNESGEVGDQHSIRDGGTSYEFGSWERVSNSHSNINNNHNNRNQDFGCQQPADVTYEYENQSAFRTSSGST